MIVVTLPWPPSTNTYFRSLRKGKLAGRVIISEAGRKYRTAVIASIAAQLRGALPRLSCRLAVQIIASPPDRRRRDLDNMLKGALDALTHAGVWEDDSQIDDLRIIRSSIEPGGCIDLTISAIA